MTKKAEAPPTDEAASTDDGVSGEGKNRKKHGKPAPVDESGAPVWHESFRSMQDHPEHPLHHLRDA